jgi:hypothetical protein
MIPQEPKGAFPLHGTRKVRLLIHLIVTNYPLFTRGSVKAMPCYVKYEKLSARNTRRKLGFTNQTLTDCSTSLFYTGDEESI